ncbi:uncharacterized protein [Ambystoma mexicanum]|uniref:uncharacterized protein n=1 Tax=Ambystoma mexicanum TaxID=8296 RepID=UPI0037E94A60
MGAKLRRDVDLLQIFLDINVEEEYIPITQAFQRICKRWRRTEKELCEKKEKLLRCESERNTLEVKLKHARNQVSVEMKRRQNAETEQEKLERQLQLVRDLLTSGDIASAPLNASMMVLFGKLNLGSALTVDGHRLPTAGESSGSSVSILSHSDISYDKTEDFMLAIHHLCNLIQLAIHHLFNFNKLAMHHLCNLAMLAMHHLCNLTLLAMHHLCNLSLLKCITCAISPSLPCNLAQLAMHRLCNLAKLAMHNLCNLAQLAMHHLCNLALLALHHLCNLAQLAMHHLCNLAQLAMHHLCNLAQLALHHLCNLALLALHHLCNLALLAMHHLCNLAQLAMHHLGNLALLAMHHLCNLALLAMHHLGNLAQLAMHHLGNLAQLAMHHLGNLALLAMHHLGNLAQLAMHHLGNLAQLAMHHLCNLVQLAMHHLCNLVQLAMHHLCNLSQLAMQDAAMGEQRFREPNVLNMISHFVFLEVPDSEVSVLKPEERLMPRKKRRSSLVPRVSQPVPPKRTRPSQSTATPENVLGALITKTSLMYTDCNSPTQPSPTVEALPRRRSRQSRPFAGLGQTSVWGSIEDETLPQIDETELEPEVLLNSEPRPSLAPRKHIFISKTVILAETCAACGKRTRFGKLSLKCRDCRLLIHPECKDICSKLCVPGSLVAPMKIGQWVLADFAPTTPPRIPSLVIQCVNEIELRGLKEKGIYRIPGCDRLVKDLKQKFLRAKGPLTLNRVDDIHAVCGLLKDFLRNLKEPLVTFYLHPHFLEAADIINEEDSKAEMCQVVKKLPLANRDTMAYIILHLHRVMQSTYCNMDQSNLSRVFGPTLIGHSTPEPSSLMIMQDTPRQARVLSRLLSLPGSFWNKFLSDDQENITSRLMGFNKECNAMSAEKGRLFHPLTSPEVNCQTTVSASGLTKKGKTGLGPSITNQATPKNKPEPLKGKRFFTSPNA